MNCFPSLAWWPSRDGYILGVRQQIPDPAGLGRFTTSTIVQAEVRRSELAVALSGLPYLWNIGYLPDGSPHPAANTEAGRGYAPGPITAIEAAEAALRGQNK